MEKSDNIPVLLSLSLHETEIILRMLRDGQFVVVPDELESKFMQAYHEANNAQVKRLEFKFTTAPFALKLGDWHHESFEQNIEEMKELKANLEAVEIDVPLNHRLEAVELSIKSIETVRDAYNHAIFHDQTSPEISDQSLKMTGRSVYEDVCKNIQALYQEFTEDYEHLMECNELDLPLGDTIQDGKVRGVRAVLALLKELENNYK